MVSTHYQVVLTVKPGRQLTVGWILNSIDKIYG